MTNARLIVDPASILLRSSGPATGDIVLMLGRTAFPTAGWNDFVVVILEGWITALLRLLRNASKTEHVHFMEGPYAVDMSRLQIDTIGLRAFERPNREHALIEVRALPLVESAIMAAEDVLQVHRDARHRSTDADRLEAAMTALREEASRLIN